MEARLRPAGGLGVTGREITPTHPALVLLRAGDPHAALALLRERGDHPAALAMLQAGYSDYAKMLLAQVPANAPEGEA